MIARFVPKVFGNRHLKIGGAIGIFFGLKILLGLALLSFSAHHLSVTGFVSFSQLFLFLALLSTLSAAGVQNGVIRQIAVARGDALAESRTVAAALHIFCFAALILFGSVFLLRVPLSHLLVDDSSVASTLPWIALAALAGGAGVLLCAILTGRDRAALSLILQSVGLIAGGGLCIWRLLEEDVSGAVIGYAIGPVATSLVAAMAMREERLRLRFQVDGLGDEARLLLSYSVTFVAVALVMPTTLFGLRYVYREAFGPELLGYWLAANRVSDVTSQVLGLYMAQVFLPQAARETSDAQLRRLLLRTFLIGTTVMLAGWALFSAAPAFFVSTFFSMAFLPAIPFIGGYLLGDALRVTASMALHLMLAQRRIALAIAVELGTAALFAVLVVVLATYQRIEAPYWSYPVAFGVMAAALWPSLLKRPSLMSSRTADAD